MALLWCNASIASPCHIKYYALDQAAVYYLVCKYLSVQLSWSKNVITQRTRWVTTVLLVCHPLLKFKAKVGYWPIKRHRHHAQYLSIFNQERKKGRKERYFWSANFLTFTSYCHSLALPLFDLHILFLLKKSH